jgi:hypothetical protein
MSAQDTQEHRSESLMAVYASDRGALLSARERVSAMTWHQFRATEGEPLGFLCTVNANRDKLASANT